MSEYPSSEKNISPIEQDVIPDLATPEVIESLFPTSIDNISTPLAGIRSELKETAENTMNQLDKTYSDYPIMWPEEDIDAITKKIDVDRPAATKADLLKAASLVGQVKGLHRHSKQIEYQEHLMSMVNGDEAQVLANKVTFHALAEEMGYTVPKQFVIDPERTAEENLNSAMAIFDDPSQEVFCKPLTGGGGRGAIIITGDAVEQFLLEHPDYILQERIHAEREFRYVRQIDHSNERVWRIAYDRIKPRVVGDGITSLLQLIRESSMPTRMKIFATLGNITHLRDVPDTEETRELSVASNPPFGSYEDIPNDQAVLNLDKFMEQFIGEIEERVGTELPTLCFDLGITDKSVLEDEYDFERMKEAVVPFECQYPFSSAAYFAKLKPANVGRKVAMGFHRTMKRERNRKV